MGAGSERRAVGAQLVSYQQFRRKPLLSEMLARQPQRRPGVPAALHQHVEDLAFVVNGTPEIHPLAGDPSNHLVQVPSIARARAASPQPPKLNLHLFRPAARRRHLPIG